MRIKFKMLAYSLLTAIAAFSMIVGISALAAPSEADMSKLMPYDLVAEEVADRDDIIKLTFKTIKLTFKIDNLTGSVPGMDNDGDDICVIIEYNKDGEEWYLTAFLIPLMCWM